MDNGLNVYELANKLSLIVQDQNVSFSTGQVAFCAAFAFALFEQGFTKEQTKKISADLIDLVYKDFKNSFNVLNDSGVIIFHDVNPFDISQTHFNNSGDVFELWIELAKTYKVYIIKNEYDGDSVGIFIKSKNSKFIDIEVKDYTYQFFSENREDFISYLNYEEIINKIKL